MNHATNTTALVVFGAMFLLITAMGFIAARWRRGDLRELNEWGLGGRRFGTVVTWFLLGGDIYTAYTFIAVPALLFGSGGIGFFALPYTIIVYPIAFVFMARLWSVASARGYVTPADFVRGRFDSRGLGTAVAVTGLLALMPYIALQLLGIKVVLAAMGVEGDWPIIIAFAVLAAYTWNSGLRALLGYMTIAAGIKPSDNTFAVPDLFLKYFPSWFEGFAFGAIAIGALVPAAVMSIAAANLFTRNIWREYVHRDADDHEQTRVARWASLFMKAGALAFVLFLPQKDAINLQLLGGVWIIQTLPAVIIGLFTRWFDRRALLVGWLAGMVAGTWIAASQDFTPTWLTNVFGVDINLYTAIWSVLLNLVITTVLTLVIRAAGKADDRDETTPADYDELVETGRPAPVAAAPTG